MPVTWRKEDYMNEKKEFSFEPEIGCDSDLLLCLCENTPD